MRSSDAAPMGKISWVEELESDDEDLLEEAPAAKDAVVEVEAETEEVAEEKKED